MVIMLSKINASLGTETSGEVLVTGHSDNVPISTRRFPSNRALSQARAEEVVKELGKYMNQAGRMRALGMADTRPIASNNTPEGRAKNRRVEITIFERVRGG